MTGLISRMFWVNLVWTAFRKGSWVLHWETQTKQLLHSSLKDENSAYTLPKQSWHWMKDWNGLHAISIQLFKERDVVRNNNTLCINNLMSRNETNHTFAANRQANWPQWRFMFVVNAADGALVFSSLFNNPHCYDWGTGRHKSAEVQANIHPLLKLLL